MDLRLPCAPLNGMFEAPERPTAADIPLGCPVISL